MGNISNNGEFKSDQENLLIGLSTKKENDPKPANKKRGRCKKNPKVTDTTLESKPKLLQNIKAVHIRKSPAFRTTLSDQFLIAELLTKHGVLNTGNINFKAARLSGILEKIPPDFIKFKNSTDLRLRCLRSVELVNTRELDNKTRIYREKCPEEYKQMKKKVFNYMFINEENIKNTEEYIINDQLNSARELDLLNQQYTVANNRSVYAYDITTRCYNVHVLIIVDLSSKVLVGSKILNRKFTGADIADAIETALVGKIKEKVTIIHSDAAGENISKDVRKKCNELGLRISFGKGLHPNNVVESINRLIWKSVSNLKYENMQDVDFCDLNFESQKKIIQIAIDALNLSIWPFSTTNSKLPPKLLEYAKDQVKLATEMCVRRISALGEKYKLYQEYSIKKFIATVLQALINEILKEPLLIINPMEEEYDPILDETDAIKERINDIDKKTTFLADTTNDSIEGSDLIIPAPNKLSPIILSKIDLSVLSPQERLGLNFALNVYNNQKSLKNTADKTLKVAENTKETITELKEELKLQKKRIEELEMQKEEKERLEMVKKSAEALEKLRSVMEERNAIEKRKEEEMIIEKRKHKTTLIRRSRRVNRAKQSNPKFSIYPEDMDTIFACLRSRSSEYATCRDILGHLLLKLWGHQISNLKYFPKRVLDDIFNYKDVLIRTSKSKKQEKLLYPFIPEFKPLIEKVRGEYETLIKYHERQKKKMKSKAKKLGKTIDREDSEFWSEYVISRDHLTYVMNKDFKSCINTKLNKQLTTESYRRGVATATAFTQGIYAAKVLLNHDSLRTTQNYITTNSNKELITRILRKTYNITKESDLNKLSENQDKLNKRELVSL